MPKHEIDGRKVWVTGHRGMVGSALVRRLEREPVTLLTAGRDQVDLMDQAAVRAFMAAERPDIVLIAAAKVGGILANDTYPADFLYENLMIEANLIDAAHRCDVDRVLFLGSSCIYPKLAEQPLKEEALLTGPLEPTNEWYAIAKIAGVKLIQAYRKQHGRAWISAMPTNLYGPGDNFDLAGSHVVPALIRKVIDAKAAGQSLEIWGSGKPMREFLHVDDLADACVFLLRHYDEPVAINVGTGQDVTIRQLAEQIAELVGFEGGFVFDSSKPDGTPRKLLDVSRLKALGWQAPTSLRDGLAQTIRWYQDTVTDGSDAVRL